MKVCVYSITNQVTLELYVGGTKDYMARKRQHLYELRHDKHPNKVLQEAYNTYGEANMIFAVLEETDLDQLRAREQHFLDELKPFYNIKPGSNGEGYKHSPETILKMQESARNRERKGNPGKRQGKALENIQYAAAKRKGQPATEKQRQNLLAYVYGPRKPHSIKTRIKMSQSQKKHGPRHSEEWKQTLREKSFERRGSDGKFH